MHKTHLSSNADRYLEKESIRCLTTLFDVSEGIIDLEIPLRNTLLFHTMFHCMVDKPSVLTIVVHLQLIILCKTV